MSGRVYIGDITNLKRLENTRTWRKGIGHILEVRYKGTELACGNGQTALGLAAGMIESSITHDSDGLYILTATFAVNSATDPGGSPLSGPDAVVTTWTREASMIDKSLWNLGPVRDALAPLNEENRAKFRERLEAFLSGRITIETWADFYDAYKVFPGVTAQNQADIQQLISAWAAGTESYRIEVFQFVRTQVGPPDQLINSDATINTMFKRSTFVSDPTMPANFKTFVPAGYFFQGASQVTVLDSSRWQITTMWEHSDAYNEWLWGASV
jgi:hypothetical protein